MRMRKILLALLILGGVPVSGQQGFSLKSVTPPAPTQLDTYVRDRKALVALGKIFFGDQQAGSDGRIACGTCHFHAGADHRSANRLASPPGIQTPITPNQILSADLYPFHKLADPSDRHSAVLSDVRQITG